MPDDAAAASELGRLLTATEATELTERLADNDTLTAALQAIAPGRRPQVRALLEAIGLPAPALSVLHAIRGARSVRSGIDLLWTMPGHLAQSGPLTASVPYLVDNARTSITCSTFNFQRSSGMWEALQRAATRPEIEMRIYVDTQAADLEPKPWSPTTAEIAKHLQPGTILRTKLFDGNYVRNHAKFLAIDHRFLLVTSANLSWSAEHGNVEFGVLIDNPNIAEAVERELQDTEPLLYERVQSLR